MPTFIDLTGKRFGRLTVIEREGTYRVHGDYHVEPTWLCKCDCGNETVVRGGNLRYGLTKSCGCLRRETASAMMQDVWRRVHDGS